MRQVAQWQQYNSVQQNPANLVPTLADDVFPDPSDAHQFASCGFSLLPNPPGGDAQGAYTPPRYWYGDAVLMKNYAGGNPNYAFWTSANNNAANGAWG
jgi:hypothetical protein